MKEQIRAQLILSQSSVPETDAVETADIRTTEKTECKAGSLNHL